MLSVTQGKEGKMVSFYPFSTLFMESHKRGSSIRLQSTQGPIAPGSHLGREQSCTTPPCPGPCPPQTPCQRRGMRQGVHIANEVEGHGGKEWYPAVSSVHFLACIVSYDKALKIIMEERTVLASQHGSCPAALC